MYVAGIRFHSVATKLHIPVVKQQNECLNALANGGRHELKM